MTHTPTDTEEHLQRENVRLQNAYNNLNEDICQTLGKALGYPWFMDDEKNFPVATAEDGVCVGDHVAESIASEAANRIYELETENEQLRIQIQESK